MLEPAFFARNPLIVAEELLGAELTRCTGTETVRVVLTEIEAYTGSTDPGSHAYRGATPRSEVMFGPVGRLYIYFSYGMHWLANIVCHGPEEAAGAVLLRAGRVVAGEEVVRQRRGKEVFSPRLACGPANLAQALALSGAENRMGLAEAGIQLRLAAEKPVIQRSARVGIRGPGADATHFDWRFTIDAELISPPRPRPVIAGGSTS